MSGYLFLTECLPVDHEHELQLMLVNTIRKVGLPTSTWVELTIQDLSSIDPAHVLLALHTIVKLPSSNLAPAVTPILTSKALLRHSKWVLLISRQL
jgi:hypothetical protein